MNQGGNLHNRRKKNCALGWIKRFKRSKRREILDVLEYAKSLGDLSENAEYHQAREDQGKLEERIAKIEQILQSFSNRQRRRRGSDWNRLQGGSAKSGSKEEKNYVIVGSEEADMASGKISNHSPFGVALLGKKKGDDVSFKTPSGMVNYKNHKRFLILLKKCLQLMKLGTLE